jgi:ParB-like chromosome segregation protein Spo0J
MTKHRANRQPATMRINDIVVGTRHRKDMGDLDALAASMADPDLGLLQPIVVRPDGVLIAGERRLRAAKLLGWTEIEVKTVDLEAVVKGEFAENTQKPFTLSEAVAIKRALEPLEKAAAKERQAASGGKGRVASGKLPTPIKGRAADKAARATGKKRRTLEKAEAVIAAAEADPALADLAARLDEENVRVEAVHRELKQRQARRTYEATIQNGMTIDDLRALVASGYKAKVIYADPPWAYESTKCEGAAERVFNTMTVDELKAMAPLVQALAAKDCALLLWGTWPQLLYALEVIAAWGFNYMTAAFVWVKTNPSTDEVESVEKLDPEDVYTGLGFRSRSNVEFVLLGERGKPLPLVNDIKQVVIAPRGRHSAKPEEVRRRIGQLFAGPYLELFARPREAEEGWTLWGNEIPQPAPAVRQARAR